MSVNAHVRALNRSHSFVCTSIHTNYIKQNHQTKQKRTNKIKEEEENEHDWNLNNRLENYTATINVLMASNNHKLI